jgi:hypothetical protein
MSEQPDEIKKLIAIASDMELSADLRTKAVELIGNIGSRDAFLALLDLAANEKLLVDERDLALKRAREIVKSGR